MKEYTLEELGRMADRMRSESFDMMARARSGHVGASLSITEILTVLYFKLMRINPLNPNWEDRDRFVLSGGHGSPGLYPILAELDFFPKQWLNEFNIDSAPLTRHADRFKVPGIEASCGALGQGISMAVGMAMAGKLKKKNYQVYCLVGDGECLEGQVHEAGLVAAAQELDKLTVFVNNNKMTMDDHMDVIMPHLDLVKMWQGLNWAVFECDGHSIKDLVGTIERAQEIKGQPRVIIAHTIKGKGAQCAEGKKEWHAWNKEASPEEIEKTQNELRGGW